MKKIQLLTAALILLFLTSCQFTEEITFNKNGSGDYNLKIDMSEMLKGMGGMKNDSIQKEPEKVDSTVYFKDIIALKKDSIAKLSKADQESLEALKDLKLHIHMDEAKEEMVMDYMLDFTNVSQLNDIQKKIEKAQQVQDNKGAAASKEVTNHKIEYFYSKKKFARRVTMIDLSEEDQKQFDKNQEQLGMFMNGSTFKLIYNFPKRIKNVSFADANFSDDRKTLFIEVSMDSLSKNPKLLDFEVLF